MRASHVDLPEKILNRDLETSHSARDILNDSMTKPPQSECLKPLPNMTVKVYLEDYFM